jgi:hypothetical protein
MRPVATGPPCAGAASTAPSRTRPTKLATAGSKAPGAVGHRRSTRSTSASVTRSAAASTASHKEDSTARVSAGPVASARRRHKGARPHMGVAGAQSAEAGGKGTGQPKTSQRQWDQSTGPPSLRQPALPQLANWYATPSGWKRTAGFVGAGRCGPARVCADRGQQRASVGPGPVRGERRRARIAGQPSLITGTYPNAWYACTWAASLSDDGCHASEQLMRLSATNEPVKEPRGGSRVIALPRALPTSGAAHHRPVQHG